MTETSDRKKRPLDRSKKRKSEGDTGRILGGISWESKKLELEARADAARPSNAEKIKGRKAAEKILPTEQRAKQSEMLRDVNEKMETRHEAEVRRNNKLDKKLRGAGDRKKKS